MTTVANCN